MMGKCNRENRGLIKCQSKVVVTQFESGTFSVYNSKNTEPQKLNGNILQGTDPCDRTNISISGPCKISHKTRNNLFPSRQMGTRVSANSMDVQFSFDVIENTTENQFFQILAWVQEGKIASSPDLSHAQRSLNSLFSILSMFYTSTNGDDWSYEECPSNSQWNIAQEAPTNIEHFENWCGLTFVGESLTEITLSNNNLTGFIPSELGNLESLTHLDLSNNQLTGQIPTELGNLSNLIYLNLNKNQSVGPIPAELGNLEQLSQLHLRENQLNGLIPAEIGNLKNLTHLDLSHNDFIEGPIPTELGNLEQLLQLHLSGNELSGKIPAEIGNLKNLTHLGLSHNRLTGPILIEILDNLENLKWLNLSYSQFTTDSFPTELLNFKQLTGLRLTGSFLTGPIPIELGNLENLTELYLSQNQLTGEIPAELLKLENLTELYLGQNQLTGEIPAELGNLENLEKLSLLRNQLTGEIPAELGNLENLEALSLGLNQLTGEIPAELGNLENLTALFLGRNQLTGEIPAELGNLENLETLVLPFNQLTGEIPAELGKLENLNVLRLEHNALVGRVPPELGRLVNIGAGHTLYGEEVTGIIYLEENRLTGALPQSLVQLKHLDHLRFNSNSGLCAPSNNQFQNWLSTLTTVTGDTCVKVSFSERVDNQSYPRAHSITPLILPEATSGVLPIVYTLTLFELPIGLRYDAFTRTVSGTPLEVTPPVFLTWKGVDLIGSEDSLQFSIEIYSPVATERNTLPDNFELRTNYPNPFQHSTRIQFDLPEIAQVTVQVVDMLGREVMAQPAKEFEAGSNRSIELSATNLASGTYLYRIIATSAENLYMKTGRMMLVR